jgi:hypothetical protein
MKVLTVIALYLLVAWAIIGLAIYGATQAFS